MKYINTVICQVLLTLLLTISSVFVAAADRDNDNSTHRGPQGPDLDYEKDEDSCPADTGSPVYLQNQTLVWSDRDVTLPGRMPISIHRHYYSFDSTAGIFGKGWSERCERKLFQSVELITDDDGEVKLAKKYVYKQSNGRTLEFSLNSAGEYQPDPISVQSNLSLEPGKEPVIRYRYGGYEQYSHLGALIKESDRNGNWISYTYGDGGELTKIINSSDETLTFSYNANGFVEKITDTTGRQWHYGYNHDGVLTHVTQPDGSEYQYRYQMHTSRNSTEQHALLTQVIDPSKVVVLEATYQDGRVIGYREGSNQYQYSRDTSTGVIEKTDSLGSTWRYWLDDQGRIIRQQLANGGYVSRSYDDDGKLVQSIDPMGLTQEYEYDDAQRTTRIALRAKQQDGSYLTLGSVNYRYQGDAPWPMSITSLEGRVTQFSYDNNGNLTRMTDGEGYTTRLTWNQQGDLLRYTNPLGQTTVLSYNPKGQPISQIDPMGYVTRYQYDARGNLTQQTDPQGLVWQQGYNSLDRLINLTDPQHNQTQFNYDLAGRLLRVTTAIGAEEQYQYDNYGRLITKTDYSGEKTQYSYQQDNRLASQTLPSQERYQYQYDSGKRLIEWQASTTKHFTYQYNQRDQLLEVVDGDDYSVRFSYDSFGRVIEEQSQQQSMQYSYDADGFITQLIGYGHQQRVTRDKRGLPTNIGLNNALQRIVYDSAGKVTSLSYSNGKLNQYQYDANGQLLSLNYPGAGSASRYQYDRSGRITEINAGLVNQSYQYDDNSRLTQAITNGKVETFNYDALGNRTNNNAEFNKANQLLSDASWTYRYDANGNRISKTAKQGGEHYQYGYNSLNQLVEFTNYTEGETQATNARYHYDPMGRRIRKTVTDSNGSTTTYFYWSGHQLVREKTGSNVREYHWLPGSYAPIALSENGELYHYHNDHLGTPQVITDSAGNVVWQAEYKAFGELSHLTASIENNIRFPGQYFDAESGQHYNFYRDYDPSLGRYIQSDPIGLDGGLNTYGYAYQNPVMYFDPDGQYAIAIPPLVLVGGGIYVICYATGGCRIPDGMFSGSFGGSGDDYYGEQCDDLEDCDKARKHCSQICDDASTNPNLPRVWGGSWKFCMDQCLPNHCKGY